MIEVTLYCTECRVYYVREIHSLNISAGEYNALTEHDTYSHWSRIERRKKCLKNSLKLTEKDKEKNVL